MPLESEQIVVPLFAHSGENFRTHLTGDEEVPPNNSKAQGQAIFQLSKDGTELYYKLNVANIENVLMAHIHWQVRGVNGSIAVWLYPNTPPLQPTLIPGRTQGTLTEGVIVDADVISAVIPGGLEGLLAEMRAGNTYVNVHTLQFPPGEIRGQID